MVTIYTRYDCQPCRLTKVFFEARGIDYREINVEDEPAGLNFVKGMGYQSAPVIVVDFNVEGMEGEHWTGLRPDKLEQLAKSINSVR